jgi:hypothetical protein
LDYCAAPFKVFEPLLPRLSSVCLIWPSLALEMQPCFLDCPILLSIYSPQTTSIMKFQICRNIFHSYNMKLHLQQLVIKTRISLGPNTVQTSYRTTWLSFFWVNGSLATAAILWGLIPLHLGDALRSRSPVEQASMDPV